jgi:hypothetical protein
MEMRIVVPEVASTGTLAERVSVVFGTERISLLDGGREVDVRVEGDSDHVVLRVLDTVERWLGEHSYRICRWAPVETWE